MGGELRVAHDREAARPGRTLESLYLEPLSRRVRRCGALLADSTPFLLLVELKTRKEAALDSLRAALNRHAGLFSTVRAGIVEPGTIDVILVGWHPEPARLAAEPVRKFFIQARIDASGRISPDGPGDLVRLVSLDYGATVRWKGSSAIPEPVRRLLAAAVEAKRAAPGRLLRVHDVPSNERVYRLLLDAGVDRIGTKDLARTRQLLVESRGGAW